LKVDLLEPCKLRTLHTATA